MSGSPPPEPPNEPPQIAGRRRKRSHTPPTTSAATVAPSPATPVEQTAPRLGAQTRTGETIAELPVQLGTYVASYPIPASYAAGSSFATSATSSLSESSRYLLSPVSPRAARKPKAHVASACVNCKKKHLRCDNNRPCRRCVQSGKEASCHDVEHKKRGRPPLKPEDPSTRRTFESAITPMGSHMGGPPRPLTGPDISSFGQPPGPISRYPPLRPQDPSRGPPMRGSFQPMYAQPSVSFSPATAAGTFASPTRPYSQSGPGRIQGQLPSSYASPHSESPHQQIAPYGGYNYPPMASQHGASGQATYSNPIFPRPAMHGSMSGEPMPPFGGPSSLQLPPIRPTTLGPIDPAITQAAQSTHQASQHSEGAQDDGTQEPDPKRPKMDIQGILGPKHD
ncbi:hypothetical protein H2204_008348 [Knufia peltigerae]|uniref:Zn(2)-C6 fungal-type domain-containing protein n=1 Tax=Knufia peltigerae TaxID=1002370 RepID=A0AA39CUQ7_9EURO|nr:hypothetical protein H2204_008348 [Knufia peltigerae]